MFPHALLVRQAVAPFIALKMMILTLRHGRSFVTPIAFTVYGLLCIGVWKDRDTAFRFGELGLELIEQLNLREYIPRVYAAYYACIHPYKYPVRDALDHLLHAHHIGVQTGDIEFSCMCANLWCYLSTDCGTPLDKIEAQWTTFQNNMRSHRQKSLMRISVPTYLFIKYNRGEDVEISELDHILQHSIANKLYITQHATLWDIAQISLIYNDIEYADEVACKAKLMKNLWRSPNTPDIVHVSFTNGMIAFACLNNVTYNGVRRRSRRQYIREGKAMLRSIRSYTQKCPTNFVDKKLLLEAELAVAYRHSGLAMEKYICAIALAKDNKSLLVQAMANERAGRYCFNILQQRNDAATYFRHALLSYQEWKAQRKVDHLQGELMNMFGMESYSQYFYNH
jgi:hypothetical protein